MMRATAAADVVVCSNNNTEYRNVMTALSQFHDLVDTPLPDRGKISEEIIQAAIEVVAISRQPIRATADIPVPTNRHTWEICRFACILHASPKNGKRRWSGDGGRCGEGGRRPDRDTFF
eukprot:TRINITY_DN12649_c0_g1_i2.p2 TRINITY_DN12649_c0_g1~~TRINITY_DN12649_c0_g1_i2.p2  ORF type:complete len:119 (-),score=5.65 TRINITY_DN12649_c0_g1_i2:35-391(-)